MLSSLCSDEMLRSSGCWAWKAGADAVIFDFERACKAAARKYPYSCDEREEGAEEEDERGAQHSNTATTHSADGSSGANAGKAAASARSSATFAFPAVHSDGNKVSAYAKVYALCRSPKRCSGVGVVDYLMERLEEAFEVWTSDNIRRVGLEDEAGRPSTRPSPLPSPAAREDFDDVAQQQHPHIEADPSVFKDIAMLSRRYFHIKKACKLQFLYVDHNSKDAVQILLRKGFRNQLQSGVNEMILCRNLEAELIAWVRNMVHNGGEFSLFSSADGGNGPSSLLDPHAPSDVIAFLDDLSLHRVSNDFVECSQEVIAQFADALATMAAEAPVMTSDEGDEGSEEEGRRLEVATTRLVHLHHLLRRAESVLVGFLMQQQHGGPIEGTSAADVNDNNAAPAATGPVNASFSATTTCRHAQSASSREQTVQRVNRCIGSLCEGTARNSRISNELIKVCGGPLFINAAIYDNSSAHAALGDIVKGLCSTHESFVEVLSEEIGAALTLHLQQSTVAVQQGESADAYYRRFYAIVCDALVRSYNYFIQLDVPCDSLFFARVTLVFKRFVDSREAVCVPAFALALHDLVKKQHLVTHGDDGSGAAEGEEGADGSQQQQQYAYAPINELSIDPLTRLVSFLAPKDFFIEAFAQTLASDGLAIAELGGATATVAAVLHTQQQQDPSSVAPSSEVAVDQQQQPSALLLQSHLPHRLVTEWDRYNTALLLLSRNISHALCSAPLAMLKDMRAAGSCSVMGGEGGQGEGGLRGLPFDCSLATLCVARWKHFTFPLLVPTTAQLGQRRVHHHSGGGNGGNGSGSPQSLLGSTTSCSESTTSYSHASLQGTVGGEGGGSHNRHRYTFGPFGPLLAKAAECMSTTDTRVLTWVLHGGSVVLECRFPLGPSYPIRVTTSPCYALILGVMDGLIAEAANELRFATPTSPSGPNGSFSCAAAAAAAASNGGDAPIPCIAKEAVVAACPWLPASIVRRFMAQMVGLGLFESCRNPQQQVVPQHADPSSSPPPRAAGGGPFIRHVRLYKGPQGRKVRLMLSTEDLATAVALASATSQRLDPTSPTTDAAGNSKHQFVSINHQPTSVDGGAACAVDPNVPLGSNSGPFGALMSLSSTFGDSSFANALSSGTFALVAAGSGRRAANGGQGGSAVSPANPDGSPSNTDAAAAVGLVSASHTIALSEKVVAFRLRTMEAYIVKILKEVQRIGHDALMERAMREAARVGPVTVAQFKQCVQTLIERDYLRRGEVDSTYEYVA